MLVQVTTFKRKVDIQDTENANEFKAVWRNVFKLQRTCDSIIDDEVACLSAMLLPINSPRMHRGHTSLK